jgi:hypothetical protein
MDGPHRTIDVIGYAYSLKLDSRGDQLSCL